MNEGCIVYDFLPALKPRHCEATATCLHRNPPEFSQKSRPAALVEENDDTLRCLQITAGRNNCNYMTHNDKLQIYALFGIAEISFE